MTTGSTDHGTPEVASAPKRSLGRTSFRVTVLAGAALVAGFAVDAVVAALFGAGADTDAFFIAATIPFAIAAIMIAVANQALVPLFVKWYGEEGSEGPRNVGGMIGAMLVIAGGIFVIGVALSPVLPRLIAPGASAATKALAADLSIVLFATVLTRTAAEALRAVLNARFSFVIPAASPLLISGGALLTMALLHNRLGIAALAFGYLFGGILQVVVLTIATMRKRIAIRLGFGFGSPAVRGGLRLLGWPTASNGLNLFARIAERFIASFLGVGAITIVNYAWRIINAIGGTVFFRSVTVVLIPSLAKSEDGSESQTKTLLTGSRIMLMVSVPMTAFLIAFSGDVVRILFERGEFVGEPVQLLSEVVVVYSLALPFIAITRVLLSTMFARLDMMQPFINRAILVAINIAAAAALAPIFGVTGIAAGFVLGIVAAFVHAMYLVKPLGIPWRRLTPSAIWVLVATLVATGIALLLYAIIPSGSGREGAAVALGVSAGVGLGVYSALIMTMGRRRGALTGGPT